MKEPGRRRPRRRTRVQSGAQGVVEAFIDIEVLCGRGNSPSPQEGCQDSAVPWILLLQTPGTFGRGTVPSLPAQLPPAERGSLSLPVCAGRNPLASTHTPAPLNIRGEQHLGAGVYIRHPQTKETQPGPTLSSCPLWALCGHSADQQLRTMLMRVGLAEGYRGPSWPQPSLTVTRMRGRRDRAPTVSVARSLHSV